MADVKFSAFSTVTSVTSLVGLAAGANSKITPASLIAPLVLEDANTVGQRNGANGQTFSVYRSYTDASNFSNVSFRCNGTTFEIALVETGTGIGGITALQFNINGLPVSIPSAVDVDSFLVASTLSAGAAAFLVAADGSLNIGTGAFTVSVAGAVVASALTVNGVVVVPVSADTGYVANADGGSKSAVIPATASLTTIATALDLVTSGAGAALKAVSEKVKALEASLVLAKLPDA